MDDVDLTVTTDGKPRGILVGSRDMYRMSIAPPNNIICVLGRNLSDALLLTYDYDTTFFHINHAL
jgi:hypothetical protein